jgi:hypothetical protein
MLPGVCRLALAMRDNCLRALVHAICGELCCKHAPPRGQIVMLHLPGGADGCL